jgi:peptidoglycan hydrolase-like protein with peptidoglycan-binding domain
MTLLAAGPRRIVKLGSAGTDVRRVQRTLDAASGRTRLPISGVFDDATDKAVAAADALGIAAGSTLWDDLEGFDLSITRCRESALAFLSAWTYRIHALGYVSGVYSSASSGIKVLDDARVTRPGAFNLPDQIWIARWDGVADTSTSYIGEDGWKKARVKQYKGGHDETWGGVRINIDSNFLDLGRGSYAAPESHCGGVRISFRDYPRLRPATATAVPAASRVRALQCRLQEEGLYTGKVTGVFSERTISAANAWQTAHGLAPRRAFGPTHWVTLLSAGPRPVLKTGSAGVGVRSVQRSLNAAGATTRLAVSGVWNDATVAALKAWQKSVRVEVSGVAGAQTWAAHAAGRR